MVSGVALVAREERPGGSLADRARDIRRRAFESVIKAGKGQLGGSLSCTEILVALYHGGVLRVDARDPRWPARDRFVLSKAHACNTLYAVLADRGFFPASHLDHYLEDGTPLGGHADHGVPGVEILGGSLGHGLGVAAGMAWGAKLDQVEHLVLVLLGDGESQEGSIWEAGAFASQRGLGNLVAITDRNRLGSEDFTERTAGLDPLADRWRAFGWEVREVDGHDHAALLDVLAAAAAAPSGRPRCVIAHTIKGKGVSFIEDRVEWHHKVPTPEQVAQALEELGR